MQSCRVARGVQRARGRTYKIDPEADRFDCLVFVIELLREMGLPVPSG